MDSTGVAEDVYKSNSDKPWMAAVSSGSQHVQNTDRGCGRAVYIYTSRLAS
jgi:hypothetical protein